MSVDRVRTVVVGMWLVLIAAGCGGPQIVNPSFPITEQWARRDMQRMERDPKPMERPLVVISGFVDPGLAAISMHDEMATLTGDRRIATISLFECLSFDECRRKVIDVVGRAFPNADPRWTTEVDVIGFSMGGLAARLAADDGPDHRTGKHLRVHCLFTIDTPNHGAARAAEVPILHPLQRDMRPGSPMLIALNSRPPGYPIIAYVRLNDKPVGLRNASVDGCPLWWIATPPFSNPHTGAVLDPRINADIARRLRGEMPLTSLPPAPLPPGS